MSLANLLPVGGCGETDSVLAVTDHVFVLYSYSSSPTGQIGVVPFSALPCVHAPSATTYSLRRRPAFIFFLNDLTLCALSNSTVEGPKLTTITASDVEFVKVSVTPYLLPDLHGYKVPKNLALNQVCTDECRIIVIGLEKRSNKTEKEIELFKTTLNVTAFKTTCTKPVPTSRADLTGCRRTGSFVIPRATSAITVHIDTGESLMNWVKYSGAAFHSHNDDRWSFQRKGWKMMMFDAAERSMSPCAILDVGPLVVQVAPTVKISENGNGILVLGNTLYSFTLNSRVLSLETVAALTTFNQLSNEKRQEINGKGPYDIRNFIRACCDI